jgi:HK97 family phage major capsid protein
MTDTNINESHKALEALREELKSAMPNKEIVEKCNSFLDGQEVKNQELVKSLAEERAAREEVETAVKSLEAELKRTNIGSDEAEAKKAELKSFENFICKGKANLSDADKKYLRTDINSDGGYLVPIQQESEIIKKITEISPIRQVAKVRTMSSKIARMPVRSALISGGYVGEGAQNTTSKSTYGREELVAKKLSVTAVITAEELQDATPNMVSEINADVAESFAQIEGAAFVNGEGPNTPSGFMKDSRISEINSGDASTIDFDNFAALEGELKTGYNAIYGFNRKTLATIRNLKDGAGAYIWRAGNLGAGIPNSINGTSYIEIPDMDDIAGDKYPIIYGDFMKGYLIGDRLGFSVIRDDVTLAEEDKVKFTFKKRHDAQVVLPEAFVKLKVSVSA